MFQDSAGTTPVTAAGQTVGLILDKSKGLAIGSELVTNGDFSSGTNWTLPSGATVSGGSLTMSSVAQYEAVTQNIGTGLGWLKVTISITTITGGQVSISYGSSNWSVVISTSGTYTCYVQQEPGNDGKIYLRVNNSGMTFVVDSISAKSIAGNHATQANSAKRPQYQTDGTYHWLQFDGTDDALVTGNVDFTGTNKMSVFCSATGDSNGGTIVSNGTPAGAGSFGVDYGDAFYFGAPSSVSFGSYGASGGYAVRTTLGITPSKQVISCVANLGGANLSESIPQFRGNGESYIVDASSGASASGNFSSNPIYIGARASSGAGYFAGNIYSLIIRGAMSDAQTITDTETWVNQRTGAY